jgi:hypothetical protein
MRVTATLGAAVLVLGLSQLSWLDRSGARPAAPLPEPELSLLAVGDTGQPPSLLPAADAQVRVGRVMALAHAAQPVDALVLLGDNFYPDGLAAHEAVGRIRDNLVRPYCGFVALSGPRSREVADSCPGAREEPIPILAVLGNHDYESDESPGLERDLVPSFVSNWSVPGAATEVHELPGGVSLVLVQSEELTGAAEAALLSAALRGARGPWRVVAIHHPVVEDVDGSTHKGASIAAFSALVREAISDSGVEVQLLLAGHEHNLQIFEGSSPGPRLVVIAGGGAGHRPAKFHARSCRFLAERMGFVRIDLVGVDDDARLVASLFALRDAWIPGFDDATLVARWSVDPHGDVRNELGEAEGP